MWEQQERTEEKPQTTTLGNMLSMIAAHDKSNQTTAELDEQQPQAVATS